MSPLSRQPPSATTTEAQADLRSSSALASAKRNLAYLWNPQTAPHSSLPPRRRTRALLRSLRYIGIFVFWRVMRYARYALVGTVVAAVGATAVGSFASSVGFFVAPPTILASLGIGTAWAVGKWGFRKLGVGHSVEEGAVREVRRSGEGVKTDGTWRDVQGPKAVPW